MDIVFYGWLFKHILFIQTYMHAISKVERMRFQRAIIIRLVFGRVPLKIMRRSYHSTAKALVFFCYWNFVSQNARTAHSDDAPSIYWEYSAAFSTPKTFKSGFFRKGMEKYYRMAMDTAFLTMRKIPNYKIADRLWKEKRKSFPLNRTVYHAWEKTWELFKYRVLQSYIVWMALDDK